MKFFTKKSIWTKIVIVLIFVMLIEFAIPKDSLGEFDGLEFGGKLVSPIMSLLVSLGDGVMGMLHGSIMGNSETLLKGFKVNNLWDWIKNGIAIVCAVVVGIFVLLGIATFGQIIAVAVVTFTISQLASTIIESSGDENNPSLKGSLISYSSNSMPKNKHMYLPIYTLTPEEIFQEKILLFNVDFFSKPKEIFVKAKNGQTTSKDTNNLNEWIDNNGGIEKYYYNEGNDEITTSPQDSAVVLRDTISKWYVGLRNIAIVCMMIVLLYIAIRILLSSVAADKAKYLQMLRDWFIGLILLASMHYIMAFSNVVVNKLTEIVSTSIASNKYYVQFPDFGDTMNDIADKDEDKGSSSTNTNPITVNLSGTGFGWGEDYQVSTPINYDYDKDQIIDNGDNNQRMITWPTNLMGRFRLCLQMNSWGMDYVGYCLCYIVLVFFTLFFVFTYLKRLLYMAFLTIIAPLVALTYPIDKITDGSAQGFDKWFKEYIFNLLIQPLHLLLYYILVTSAFDLAATNMIYALVAIGFMMPAEKLLRSFFGFEKAHTPPAIGGPAATALTLGAMNKLAGLGKSAGSKLLGSRSNNSNHGGGDSDNDNENDRTRFDPTVDATAETMAMGGDDSEDYQQDQIRQQNDSQELDSTQAALYEQQAERQQQDPSYWTGFGNEENMIPERSIRMQDINIDDQEEQQPRQDQIRQQNDSQELDSTQAALYEQQAERQQQDPSYWTGFGNEENMIPERPIRMQDNDDEDENREEQPSQQEEHQQERQQPQQLQQEEQPQQPIRMQDNDNEDENRDEQPSQQEEHQQERQQPQQLQQEEQPQQPIRMQDNDNEDENRDEQPPQQSQRDMNNQRNGFIRKNTRSGRIKIKRPKELKKAQRQQGRKIFKAKVGNGIRKLPGVLSKGAVTVASAAIGVSAGAAVGAISAMVQGDPSDVVKYATGGLYAGTSTGGNLGTAVSTKMDGVFKVKDNEQIVNKVRNRKEYDEINRQTELYKFMRDKELRTKMEDKFGKEKTNEMYKEDGIMEEAYKNGFTEFNDIATMQEMIDDRDIGQVSNVKQAIAVAKTAQRVGENYDGPQADKWREHISQEYQDRGRRKQDADKGAKTTMNLVKSFNGKKKKNNRKY